jgi:hypothetical protein
MSHYHLEIIMPRTADISKSIEEIMLPFSENEEENEDHSGHSFWDFYVIGGRWAGAKERCTYNTNALEQFYIKMQENKITVSGITCGKQSISPESQIPLVDKIWNELFPTETGEIVSCPLFAHSNNQYDSNDLLSCDISRVDEIPENLKCERVIIAGPDYSDKKFKAQHMLCESIWNGVNHVKTTWNGNVLSAISEWQERIKKYKEEYAKKHTVQPDWLCITIDYHS